MIAFPAWNDPDYQSSKPLQAPPITFAIKKKLKIVLPTEGNQHFLLQLWRKKKDCHSDRRRASFSSSFAPVFPPREKGEGAALRSGGTSLTLSFVFEYLTFALSVSQRAFPE
jgi:hypothetical protein